VQAGGTLLRSSPSIGNGGTDTCWIVVTDDQRLAFATSFFGDGRISSYEVDDTGLLRLLDPVATASDSSDDGVNTGASDLALSRDSSYLYQLNSLDGTVTAFSNSGDGSLTLIEKEMPFPQPPFGPGMGEGAPLGLTAS
jgi:6-phosphogluconolactonase (cycloisomerase 2 family)